MSQPSKRRRSGRNKKSKEPPPRTHSLDDILQHSGDEALADENVSTASNSSQTELSGEESPLAKRSKSDSNSTTTAASPELEATKHKVLPELTSITTENLLPNSPP